MKNITRVIILAQVFILVSLSSCMMFKNSPKIYVIDLVCGMKVDKAEAYTWKYDSVTYYFDTYNCKESFKMNPKKYIENKCVIQK